MLSEGTRGVLRGPPLPTPCPGPTDGLRPRPSWARAGQKGSAQLLCLDCQPPRPPHSGLGGRLGPACPGPQAGVRALAPCLHSRVCPRREGGTGAVLGLPEQHRSPGGWARWSPPRGALCPGCVVLACLPSMRMEGSRQGGSARGQEGSAGRAAAGGAVPLACERLRPCNPPAARDPASLAWVPVTAKPRVLAGGPRLAPADSPPPGHPQLPPHPPPSTARSPVGPSSGTRSLRSPGPCGSGWELAG